MDAIFNLFKIRYPIMDTLIMKHCKEIGPNSKINLFINIEPIIRKLSTSNVDEYLKVKTEEKSYELISNIVNLAAHYRMFFSKNKLYSNVYMYVGYPFGSMYKSRAINPNYRKTYEHKFTKDPKSMVLSNSLEQVIPFVKIILEYIEGVYFIESGPTEPSAIPQVILNHKPTNAINFILTTDRYEYQYTNKDFYILRPKKLDSYIVSKNNVIETMKLEDKIVNETTVGPNFVPFIISILGDRYRDIKKIKSIGLSTIISLLNLAIQENIIGKDVSNISILSDTVKEEYRAQVLSNFYTVDIDTQIQSMNMKDTYHITDQLVDKFDNVSLKNINDQYFREYPIYLLELLSAAKLKTKKGPNVFGGDRR